jgi:hypothetical protein
VILGSAVNPAGESLPATAVCFFESILELIATLSKISAVISFV